MDYEVKYLLTTSALFLIYSSITEMSNILAMIDASMLSITFRFALQTQ